MDPAIWAALIAGVAGAISGGISLYASRNQASREDSRQERITLLENELAQARANRERQIEAETVLARYRDPLITATFELQDRLQNLLRATGKSVLVYLAVPERAALTIRSTFFRFAQYFGWAEIVRREVQFVEVAPSSAMGTVQDALGKVGWAFATDKLGSDFMLWREEQRAIGEQMLSDDEGTPTIIGFATFDDRYPDDFAPWLEAVATTLRSEFDRRRLVELHHCLIDLGKRLDPGELRYAWSEWDFRDPRYAGPELDLDGSSTLTDRHQPHK
jgi:hypothetical protein